MNPHWLLAEDPLFRLLAVSCMLAPALLILLSRRCGWLRKLVWAGVSQLPWLFLWLYLWIAQTRYPQGAPPLSDALGWWMLAFPWGVYLLYRGTRRRFAGEAPHGPPGSSKD
jgi:hypothetical protein